MWYFQIFYRSPILTFTTPLSSLRQLTPATSFFSPALLFGNSKQLTNITTRINFLHRFSSFLIHNHIYYSLTIFFGVTIFLPVFLISTLLSNLFLHTATSISLFHYHVSKCLGLPLV